MEEVYFPILLKSKRKCIILSDHVRFEEVTKKERALFFNIKEIEVNDNGTVVRVMHEHAQSFDCHYDHILYALDMSAHNHLKASNFFLIVPTLEKARDTIFAIKLIENTSTKITLGHYWDNDEFGIRVLYHPYDHGIGIFNIDNHEEDLRQLLSDIDKHSRKKKYLLLQEKFLNTLSLDIYNKFLGYVTILENLLVDNSKSEISYKFRLRFAFIISSKISCTTKNIEELYLFGRQVYNIRSEIIHYGHSSGTRSIINDLETYTRLILHHYVKEPADFENATLDNIILKGTIPPLTPS